VEEQGMQLMTVIGHSGYTTQEVFEPDNIYGFDSFID